MNIFRCLCKTISRSAAGLSLLFLLTSCDLIDPVLPAIDPPPATTTPFPTATTDPSGRFIAYLSTDFGVSLRHPPNWIVNDDGNLKIASSAELLTRPDTGGDGALLVIDPAPESMIEGDNLAGPLRNFVVDQGEFKIVEEPNNILIGGQPAAILTSISNDASGREITEIFAIIKNGKAGVIATATTADPAFNDALLRGIIGTIIVSRPEPTPAPPTLTPRPPTQAGGPETDPEADADTEGGEEGPESGSMSVPAGLLQFEAADGAFSLGYPADWRLKDDGSAVILASTDELLADNKFETGASILIFSKSVSTPDEPDPVKLLEDFIAQFAIYDTLELVVPPRPIMLGGQNAATAQYDVVFQRFPVLVDYYIVVNGQRIVIVVNLITAKDFEALKPITDGIAASITINP